MLMAFGLVMAGFVLGAGLTAWLACQIIAHLHEVMAREIEGYGLHLFSSAGTASCAPSSPQDTLA